MRMLRLFRGIRSRLMVISILPVLVVATVLSSFSLYSRYHDLSRALALSGEATAAYIAATAELSLYAADQTSLERLGQNGLSTPAVVSIGFLDRENRLLATAGDPRLLGDHLGEHCEQQDHWAQDLLWLFCRPVIESLPNMSDFGPELDEEADRQPQHYGWVVLALSRADLLAQQRQNIQIMLAVALLAAIGSALVALRMAKAIADPVMSLTHTIRELEAGYYTTRAAVNGPLETRILARGVNSLAQSVAEAQERLEGKVDDATRQLTHALKTVRNKNTDLEQAQQELQQAMAAKDQFLARMSHELRTPLTAVTGFTRLLSHTTQANERAEYIEHISNASTLLLDTIDGILNFSKLQSNAIAIESIEFDFLTAMESLVAMHTHQAFSKSLELVLIVDSDVPSHMIGDPTCIKQIINNLLTNAIKFTDRGEVVLRISLSHSQQQPALSFEVRDSGVGISQENLARLFQPFTQADDSITRRFGGTGLGLVICKQLVELMDGSIAIASRLDKGSCATVILPLRAADHSSQPPDHPPCQSLRTLIYDRHTWSRRALRGQLARWTHAVFTAHNPQQLTTMLQAAEQPFGLVVMGLSHEEIQEPSLSAQLTELRCHHQGPLLILACTSDSNAGITDGTAAAYAPLWGLSKPLRQKSLRRFLQQLNATAATLPESSTAIATPLAGLHILIAEDNHYNRRLVEAVLQSMGATTVAVSNGAEAVEHFKVGHFDAVILDVHMPVMDGITATRKIVALAGEQGVPIVGLTANVMETERQALLDAGAVDILYKPLNETQIANTLCELAGKKAQPDPGHHQTVLTATATSQELYNECERLLEGFDNSIMHNRLDQAAATLHELLGLTGLFKLQQVRVLAMELNTALQDPDPLHLQSLIRQIRAALSLIR